MKQKEILVMTSFGPVPFDAIKEYINSDVAKAIDKNRDIIATAIEAKVPMNLDYYLCNIAKRMNWSNRKTDNFLCNLADISVSAAFSIVLREIAIELDKKYEDHIEKSEKIYCVSTTNGRIFELNKKYIKNFRNFAAFRTVQDAKTACKITRYILKDMFKSGKK